VKSSPKYTVVAPGSAVGTIASGAYNSRDGSLCASSSWGPTRIQKSKPDLVSPGVNIMGVWPENVRGTMTGTSVRDGNFDRGL